MKERRAYEEHPSFGMISMHRISTSPPGAVLFQSDVQHHHSVVLAIHHAERKRDLLHDWVHPRDEIIEVQMSEAQWASFLSSGNSQGVPCTLKRIRGEQIEGLPFAPRLQESLKETHEAAQRAFDEIQEAMRIYEETPSTPAKDKRAAWYSLRATINNAVPNVDFAGEVLAEHAENVVQRARADIEAMVSQHASKLGIEAPTMGLLGTGEEDPS